MDLGSLEHTKRLWEEELKVYGKKTLITQGKINKLEKYIDRVYRAYSKANKICEQAQEFINDI